MKPVRWVNGVASRGHLAAAPFGSSYSQAQSVGLSALPVTNARLPMPTGFGGPGSTPEREAISSEQEEEEHRLFHKFLESGIQHVCNAQIGQQLVLFFKDISRQSKTLVLVLAALQLLLDNGPDISSLAFIDRAIGAFRSELSELRFPGSIDLLSCGLFTCTICILQAQPFTQYLRPLTQIHNLPEGFEDIDPDLSANPISWHLLEVLSVMDLPPFVVGRRSPSLGLWKRIRGRVPQNDAAAHDEVEIVTGMPKDLLDIFAHVMEYQDETMTRRFWNWRCSLTDPVQNHRSNSWRYAGILDIRRRRSLWAAQHSPSPVPNRPSADADYPSSESVLAGLLSSLDAFCHSCESAGHDNQNFLNHGLLYPIMLASLEVRMLDANPPWKQLLDSVKQKISDGLHINYAKPLFDLLDEAWACRNDLFDIENVAYNRGIEIALF